MLVDRYLVDIVLCVCKTFRKSYKNAVIFQVTVYLYKKEFAKWFYFQKKDFKRGLDRVGRDMKRKYKQKKIEGEL